MQFIFISISAVCPIHHYTIPHDVDSSSIEMKTCNNIPKSFENTQELFTDDETPCPSTSLDMNHHLEINDHKIDSPWHSINPLFNPSISLEYWFQIFRNPFISWNDVIHLFTLSHLCDGKWSEIIDLLTFGTVMIWWPKRFTTIR